MIYVILTGRLGTKTPVVNTKWSWDLSFLPWNPDHLLLFIHVFVLRVVQRVLLQTFQEDSTCLNRFQGRQRSVRQGTSKYVTVTLDTDEERINLPCTQIYTWKKKLAV